MLKFGECVRFDAKKGTGLAVQVASTFTSSPIEDSLRRALPDTEVAFHQYSRMSGYMLSGEAASPEVSGTLVLLRVEDWLRGQTGTLPAGDPAAHEIARSELKLRTEEFVSHLGALAGCGKPVWLLPCPSAGWIAGRHKLEALCRTYTNLAQARARSLSGVTLLRWPELPGEVDDRGADRLGQIPFTQEAFDRLGDSIGEQVRQSLANGNAGAAPKKEATAADRTAELASYLANLRVRVRLTAAAPDDHRHVDRLLRTAAAFSLTGENRELTESEVSAVLAAGDCSLIDVKDRDSDRDASGLVTPRVSGNRLVVDAFTLSCPVLGKQVEHAVVSALISQAAQRGLESIFFSYRPAARNQPMRTFLESIAAPGPEGGYVLPLAGAESRLHAASVNANAWTVEWEPLPVSCGAD